MSTELTVPVSEYTALAHSSLVEVSDYNCETPSFGDLIRVSTPTGGGQFWSVGEDAEKEITGILCFYTPRGILWPTDGEGSGKDTPVLETHDLKTAYQMSDDMGDLDIKVMDEARMEDDDSGYVKYDWQKLGYNQWGSGKGRGKRTREQRILGILRPGDVMPILVNVSPGSVKAMSKFIIQNFNQQGKRFFEGVVTLGLKKAKSAGGIEYSQIAPSVNEYLEADAAEVIRTSFTDPLKSEFDRTMFENAMRTS